MHSTQPVPLGSAEGLMPSIPCFMFTFLLSLVAMSGSSDSCRWRKAQQLALGSGDFPSNILEESGGGHKEQVAGFRDAEI